MPPPLPPFDLDLLRTFVAIAEGGSFTRAADRLGRTQSTVSLQVKRLEDGLGKRLFVRDGRGVALSPGGEILLTFARRLLATAGEAYAVLSEPELRGAVRLGTPEDFATTHLPDVLWRFSRAHPQVALEVRCDFTANLLEDFERDALDLVLCRREPQGSATGIAVWRDALVWVASERLVLDPAEPLPMVLAPAPDLHRRRAVEALDAVGRRWRIAYTSPSLAGLRAAVSAGLGVSILSREMLTPGFHTVGEEAGLPRLADMEIALIRRPGPLPPAVERLAEHIVRSLERGGVPAEPA